MLLTSQQKEKITQDLIENLKNEAEIKKLVIFGSFLNSDNPHDLDLVVFQDSKKDYLSLAMKYRKKVRETSKILPLDIIPLKLTANTDNSLILQEINKGLVIYEK